MLKYIYMEWYIEELQFYSSGFNFGIVCFIINEFQLGLFFFMNVCN